MTKRSALADGRFARVAATFTGDADVKRARRFGSDAVLSAHGKIFAMMVGERFVVKLPKQRVDALIAQGRGEPFELRHGRAMKEWVAVTAQRSWLPLAREARAFVDGLRAKA